MTSRFVRFAAWSSLVSFAVLFVLMPFSGSVAAADTATVAFDDVASRHPYQTAVAQLKGDGVIQGYPDGKFRPDSTINRAEFLKIVVGAIEKNPSGSGCFKDVGDEWFAKYVCAAKARGIVNGYGDGGFRPGQNISVVEASKVLTKAFETKVSGLMAADIWYRPYVESLADAQAIPVSVTYPEQKVTRAEMSEMVYRLADHPAARPSQTYASLTATLPTFSSCDALRESLSLENYKQNWRPRGGFVRGGVMAEPLMMENAVGAPAPTAAAPSGASGAAGADSSAKSIAAPTAPASSSSDSATLGGGTPPASADTNASPDYSTTNVQVTGVDEADIVKTDGQYIYLVKGKTIRIVSASPATDMKELQRVTMDEPDFYPQEMYVAGTHLTVVGNHYGGSGSQTLVYIFDITDRTHVTQVRKVSFDGSYVSSRRIGENVYFVMREYPRLYEIFNPSTDGVSGDVSDSTSSEEKLVPQFFDSKINKEQPVAGCNQIRFFPHHQDANYLIVASVPLAGAADGSIVRQAYMGSGDTIYASLTDLYVGAQINEYDEQKQYDIWQPPIVRSSTQLYRFALDNGTVTYKTTGSVPGVPLNQFSLDESGDTFRIATSKGDAWSKENTATNQLYVLDRNNLSTVLGSVDDIGRGEHIKAVRFIGNRAYVVTFKNIDPLFVIDLSDARKPTILGELKIPGYSDYLHPYDETHLIGFGKEVDESIDADKVHSENAVYYTAVLGLKMALFDVADPTHPKELFKEVIGDRGSDSPLLTDHRALLFSKGKNLIAFPVSVTARDTTGSSTTDPDTNNLSDMYPQVVFRGAYVYGLDLEKGFQLKGKISHEDPVAPSDSGDSTSGAGGATGGAVGAPAPVAIMPIYGGSFDAIIQRLLYIGNTLYSVSQAKVQAHALDTLKQEGSVTLEKADDSDTIGGGLPPPMIE